MHMSSRSPHHRQLIIAPISGKSLGGSSSINFYVFTQPPASDIDGMLPLTKVYTLLPIVLCVLAIEKLGNPGWNWETYLRYSRKSERYVTSHFLSRYSLC